MVTFLKHWLDSEITVILLLKYACVRLKLNQRKEVQRSVT